MNHPVSPSISRKPVVAALLFLVGGVALGYISVSLLTQFRLPSDGVLLTEFSPAGFSVATRLLPSQTGLRVGDKLLRIDGRSIWDWVAQDWEDTEAPHWEVGQRVIYQIEREGALVEVPVTLGPFPWGRLPVMRFGVYGLVIISLVVSIYILLRRPEDTAVQLLFIAALCTSLVLCLHAQVMVLMTPWLFVFDNLVKWLARAVLFSVLLHLFLIFPVSKFKSPVLKKHLWALHVVNPLISVVVGLIFARSPVQRWAIISNMTSWVGLLMLVGGIVSMLHTYFTVHNPMVLGQIRWMAWGSLVGFVPYLVFTGIPEALRGRPILSIEVTAFFIVMLPITVAIAVAHYRLFDIDILIWWTLLYTLYILLWVGIYLILRMVIDAALVTFIGTADPGIAVFVTCAVVISGFWVLRPYALRYVDRILYRRTARPQLILASMTEKLTSAIHLDELATLLAVDLPRQLGATRGGLMVLAEEGDALELVGADNFRLPLDERFDLWREHNNEPILRSNPSSEVPQRVLDLMYVRDVELAIPLRVGERLVGLLSLGTRQHALSYATGEVRMLKLLAHQSALAVQNALLVREMQAQQLRLQEEVELRTRVMFSDRDRLNAILQNMADALLVTNASAKIQLVNPAFENLMRRASRSLIGLDIQDVLPLPSLLDAIDKALLHPGIIEIAKITLTDPRLALLDEGTLTERVLDVSVTALGDRSSVICILRDITHEVEIDRIKSEFISAVSHELRTPLTSILGFAKLIHRTFGRSIQPVLSDEEEMQRAVNRVEKNLDILIQEAERLQSLVDDVLDIASLDAGSVEWDNQPCDILALIQDTVEDLREQAVQKDLVLKSVLADELPVLHADPQRIRQILFNLVSNAIKFTEQGYVILSARSLESGEVVHGWRAPPEGGILISVADTGVGIPYKDMPQLFGRFSQGGDMMLNKPKGTGLGLAISREIVYHYGGEIWAESELGHGSTFYVALPNLGPPLEDLSE